MLEGFAENYPEGAILLSVHRLVLSTRVCALARTRFSFLTIIKVAILLLMVAAVSSPLVFASSPTSGYVQYAVTLNGIQIGSNSPNTFTLNESAPAKVDSSQSHLPYSQTK
jgi:hypothetical protein